MTPSSPSLRIVLDTSGSMSGRPLKSAKALAGAIYLSLTPHEQRDVRWFQYSSEVEEIAQGHVPRLSAGGGTRLASLQPLLDASDENERWLILTDGEFPDLDAVKGRIALVLIDRDTPHSDPRCIAWSDDLESNPLLLERACQRLQNLLR
jgi:hypothetical protein